MYLQIYIEVKKERKRQGLITWRGDLKVEYSNCEADRRKINRRGGEADCIWYCDSYYQIGWRLEIYTGVHQDDKKAFGGPGVE